jgi:spore germination protein YaaH
MPANKVSLGVPLYGIRWTNVAPGSVSTAGFVQDNEGDKQKKWKTSTASWPDVIPELRKTYQSNWDENEQAHWIDLTQNEATSIAWYEDAQSLAPKLKLAVDRKFRWGISAWVLGQEDPEFWTTLKENYRVFHPQIPKLTGTANKRSFAAARRMHVDKRAESNTAQGK